MKRSLLLVVLGLFTVNVLFAQTLARGSASRKNTTVQHHRSHRVMRNHQTSVSQRKVQATTQSVTAPRSSQAPLAAIASYTSQGSVSLAPSTPLLTAVDPYANPAKPNPLNASRPYWYSADASGFTILKLADNTKLGSVAWPATIDLAQPDGTTLNVPAPAAGWVPVSLLVPYPSLEAIGPEAIEGSSTQALVLMAHSGYEWRSSNGRFRDQIAPAASADTESSMLVMVDVTDPTKPAVLSAALLGHNAGQMAWEPSAGAVYVGGMPSTSLPAGLQSFISKITPPEVGAEPPPPFAPKTLYPLCGPEIEWSGELKTEDKMGIPVNVPEAWICDTIHGAGEGEGPFAYQFTGLPTWLTAHIDKATGEPDGLLYGTPTVVGTYTFVVTVTDHAVEPPGQASAVITIDVKPTVTEFTGGEWEGGEAGVLGALAIQGTGDCTLAPGETPVPSWVESIQVPNGCVILGKPTLAGEYYNFVMTNFKFLPPYDVAPYSPVVWSGEVLGTYGFDSLPAGVGISGLAWHEVDMIPGEPDKYVLNGEFIGIDPSTGQLYSDALPYEQSDTIEEVGPPATIVDRNEVSTEGTPLAGSGFGNVVVEADRDIYVAADGAVIKVSGGAASNINVPGAAASFLALDSNLAPAVKPDLAGPGQIDHGVLFVTGPNSGNVMVIDTAAGTVNQTLAVAGASSLGGVSVDSATTGLAYVAGKSLQNVSLFGSGTGWNTAPTIAVINPAEALVDLTQFTIGQFGSFKVIATGWPIPVLSLSDGTLPSGVTFVDNGDGTATVSGIPGAGTEAVYTLAATASNAAGSVTQAFTLTVNALGAPGITSANSATLTLNIAGQFKVEATGTPTPLLSVTGALPPGVTFHDNGACSPAIPVGCTGSAFLGGVPTSTGTYALTITATNSQGTATQEFTLKVGTDVPSAITSTNTITFKLQTAGTFTVTATGSPTPKLSEAGALPNGVTFTDNLNGTATVAGTPTVDGSYPFTITASNGFGTNATQKFYLVVSRTSETTKLLKTAGLSSPSESLALDPRTGEVFAMNAIDVDRPTGRLSTPAVTHLDNAGNVIASIPVEQDAEYLAVNSNTHRLYVPQWDRSRETNPTGTDNQGLAIIDTVKNELLTTIPMPIIPGTTSKYLPTGVAVDEWNNVIYISATTPGAEGAEEGGGDRPTPKDAEGGIPGVILAFDGNDNSYLGSVTAGLDPESLVFNPTAKRVYTANEDDGSVTSVAGVTRDSGGKLGDWSAQTPTTIPLIFPTTCALSDTGQPLTFGEADKMVVNPVTNKVYITDDAYQIAEIDSATDTVTRRLQIDSGCGSPVLANNLAIILDRGAMIDGVPQGILYATSEGNRISIIDLSTFTVSALMTVEGAQHIDWPVINPQHRLFITDESWPVVFVYDLNDGLTPVPSPFLITSELSMHFGGIAMGGSSNAQILTIYNTGDAPLNITNISFTGDFKSSNSCVTALQPGASCQLAINFNPAGMGTRSGMVTISNNAALSPHQVALFGSGTDFQLGVGAGGSSQTIQSGQSAAYNLNVSGISGFSGPVVLSCSGVPAGSTCNVTPSTVTISGSTAEPFSVTVTTTARHTVAAVSRIQLPPAAWLFCLALLLSLCACMRLAGSARVRRMTWAAASCGVLLIAIAGCGGHSNPPPVVIGTPAGTYTVVVTATSSGATRTMPLTLVVK